MNQILTYVLSKSQLIVFLIIALEASTIIISQFADEEAEVLRGSVAELE